MTPQLTTLTRELLEELRRVRQGYSNLIEFKLLGSQHFAGIQDNIKLMDALIAKAELTLAFELAALPASTNGHQNGQPTQNQFIEALIRSQTAIEAVDRVDNPFVWKKSFAEPALALIKSVLGSVKR